MLKTMKILCLLYIGIVVSAITYPVIAAEKNNETEITIVLDKSTSPTTPPPIVNPKQPPVPKPGGVLPQLGELLTSFIFLLVGCSLLIIVIGVFNLKKVYVVK